MKKILVALVVCCLVFSFSLTATAGPKVPKHVADAMKAEGSDFTFILWFPFVPELGSPFFWSTYLVISNFYERTVRLNVWATALGEAPTLKQYTLADYERRLLTLKDFGLLGDQWADVYISAGELFGAAALLYNKSDNGVQTAFPPIQLEID